MVVMPVIPENSPRKLSKRTYPKKCWHKRNNASSSEWNRRFCDLSPGTCNTLAIPGSLREWERSTSIFSGGD
jgi:hypothetical protein